MPVTGIDHVNIRTTDVARSAQFYVGLFGFRFSHGPEVMGNRANWLFDDRDQPIIHFRVMEADSTTTGPLDHVALRCEGKADILERLKAQDIPFQMAENLTPGVTQIFLKDPHGIPLELNFTEA